MVLGKLPVPGRPTIWITVGQGPTALAVGAGGGCLDIFTLIYPFSPLSPSLWETARYRLKYCLKGPLNPKQPTNYLNNVSKLPNSEVWISANLHRGEHFQFLLLPWIIKIPFLKKGKKCFYERKLFPLTLLQTERPKLHTILAFLSAIG